MHKTPFAGLTELDPGDPITVDGSSFTEVNPSTIDYYLRIGAVTHRHDAHAKLPDPAGVPSAAVFTTGGQIAAGQDVWAAYTLVDADGGETRRSPAVQVTTASPANAPSGAIGGVFSSAGGSLPVGQYAYAVTLNDGGGGETTLGPAVFVQRPAGFASGEIILSGLTAELGALYVSWNLWRAQDGGDFQIIGTGSTGTFTDTGLICTDASRTPPVDMSSVLATNSMTVTLPSSAEDSPVGSASVYNIYLSPDGTFTNPCFYASAGRGVADTPILITSLSLSPGAPPSVSLSTQGASKIDPDTDMLDFPWKRPVANFASLPSSGNDPGDTRIALDTFEIYSWTGSAWESIGGGGGGGGGAFGASAADGSQAQISGLLGFAMASGGSVHIQNLGGGSGVIVISVPSGGAGATGPAGASGAPGATGPTGPTGPAGAGSQLKVTGSGGVTPVAPVVDVEFTGSGGVGVAVQNLGGGSARVLVGRSRRVVTASAAAAPAVNTDVTDIYSISSLGISITSFTTNLAGTPRDGDSLIIRLTDNGIPRSIVWGSSFESSTVSLPTTTVASTLLTIGFLWNTATSKWRCVAAV